MAGRAERLVARAHAGQPLAAARGGSALPLPYPGSDAVPPHEGCGMARRERAESSAPAHAGGLAGRVANLVRWRCHDLAQEGILLEIGADLSISVGEGGRGRVTQA